MKLSEIITTLTKEFPQDELVSTMPYTDDEINNMQDLVKFDFNEFGNTDEVDTMSDTDFSYKVTVKVTEETYEKWKELKSRMNDILGYDNESIYKYLKELTPITTKYNKDLGIKFFNPS